MKHVYDALVDPTGLVHVRSTLLSTTTFWAACEMNQKDWLWREDELERTEKMPTCVPCLAAVWRTSR